jgi:hypothetical protein
VTKTRSEEAQKYCGIFQLSPREVKFSSGLSNLVSTHPDKLGLIKYLWKVDGKKGAEETRKYWSPEGQQERKKVSI